MADRKSLGIIGFIVGGITATVIGVGVIVVQGHLNGRLTLDNGPRPVMSASLPIVLN
ncbi:MAG: hypothetical protein ACJ8DQ_20615 [Xanthobacteraceae bacterium]